MKAAKIILIFIVVIVTSIIKGCFGGFFGNRKPSENVDSVTARVTQVVGFPEYTELVSDYLKNLDDATRRDMDNEIDIPFDRHTIRFMQLTIHKFQVKCMENWNEWKTNSIMGGHKIQNLSEHAYHQLIKSINEIYREFIESVEQFANKAYTLDRLRVGRGSIPFLACISDALSKKETKKAIEKETKTSNYKTAEMFVFVEKYNYNSNNNEQERHKTSLNCGCL